VPIRFVPGEKIAKGDKLLLAFDALVLSAALGKMPAFGKITHGQKQVATKVILDAWVKTARSIIEKILAQQASPPVLVLNRHCSECEFRMRCREVAIEKDDLSLLYGMTEKERKQQHNKGIFTVTQLSYTFRYRRKPKRFASKPDKYSPALKALAIRGKQIHITGKPEIKIEGTPVYLDVEGIPDRGFYYLIGLRISSDSSVQHSLWANDVDEERRIWTRFLRILSEVENPRLIHYGSYETVFLKRMKERYGASRGKAKLLDSLIENALNVLSVIYGHIYFPTYSNGLKDIAQHLGFQWSDGVASGFNSLIWRSDWEASQAHDLKERLIIYNAEDCEALERVSNVVTQLCDRQAGGTTPTDDSAVNVDLLKPQDLYRYGKKEFSIPEFHYINKAAYWDYQREKIYVRSNKRLRHVSQSRTKVYPKLPPVNKVIECRQPSSCPNCKASAVQKHNKLVKIIYDLKFGPASIKRWVVKYLYQRFSCGECGTSFYSSPSEMTGHKIGPHIVAYFIYQTVELLLPNDAVAKSLKQLFGFRLRQVDIHREKSRASQLYKETYERIMNKIVTGKLIHADETRANIKGKGAYVWVFTNLEEVVYLYTETREGDFLPDLLKNFDGVLVSDFYAVYDSINCPQQKCLIHLMRDLNDEIAKEPFNEELKAIVQDFAVLLRAIVETVDKFGLKTHFLRKHKVQVERFYKRLSKQSYESETALKCKKRFEKTRGKLFTFLDYDGIPWNNNNAEHAVKAFARLRDKIRGSSTEKGIQEYLIFLSISETCKYKGISFLDFLRSGERDIDQFMGNSKQARRSGH
jgi:predicted RecB family nuclease